tara:strand:- start:213 stop:4214 length:4002 start_codon:yes stop_codon:yes gene_type:complete
MAEELIDLGIPTTSGSPQNTEPEESSDLIDLGISLNPESETQESTTQEIAEGIASGLIAIPQGIAELGASAVDLVFDTNYTQDVTDFANTVREMGGIDPEGAAGEIAEVVTQFVIPGLGAAGAVSKLSRVKNLPKLAQKAAQIGAAGVTDAVVATDGVTTIGDFFGGGITQTTDTVGLEGREAAAAKIGNKLKIGLEAAGATAAVDPILKALGYTGKGAVKVTAPVAAPVARVALQAGSALSSGVQKLADEHPLVDGFLSSFRFRGNLSQETAEARSRIRGEVDAELGQVSRTILQIEDGINTALKEAEDGLEGASTLTRQEVLNEFYSYLTKDEVFVQRAADAGVPPLKLLPPQMQAAARKARVQVDRLSKQIQGSDYLAREGLEGKEAEAAEIIQENIGSYLRRRYKIFEDKNYIKSEAFAQNRLDTIDYFMNNPNVAKNIDAEIRNSESILKEGEDILVEGGRSVLTRDAAERLTDNFIDQYTSRNFKSPGSKSSQRVAANKLRTGLFKSRQANNEMLRRLMGEVKDPVEALTTTVADMAEFVATDRFYKFINENLVDDASGMFISQEAFKRLPGAAQREYEQLGEGFGSLKDAVYAKNNVYKDLTMQTYANTRDFSEVMRASYSAFLRGKGITQYGATVLSPVTQIRNFTSSSLFALAQGNVGTGANLFDSIGTVWKDIVKRPDKQSYFKNLQRMGVVGTQSQLREIDNLISMGYGVTKGAVDDPLGIPTSGKLSQKFKRGKSGMFLSSVNKRMRDLYQGGDDVWKVYNFEFERNKLLSAFDGNVDAAARAVLGDEGYAAAMQRAAIDGVPSARAAAQALDEHSANLVKNLVPNYERVPEFIKGLRKLPVGNFIAFPAEILRTSANTFKQALDELASANPKIREIGMRRLMGFTTTTMVIPTAMQKMALDLTGTTQEQIDAIRENGAPWEQNAILLPTSTKVGVNGENVITGYVNYSYTNPYSYLNKPARAILNAVSKGEDLGSDTNKIATDAVLGAVKEMFEPFAGESILTERLLDATIRNGVTKTGAKVYREDVDTPGDKVLKSMAHISGAFLPGGAKLVVDIKGQKKETQAPGFEVGRLARAFSENTVDPAGNERFMAQEIFRALSGVTETEVKPENVLMYRGFEYGRALQSASQIFNSAVSTRGVLDDNSALETYRDANEARFRIANEMYRTIQNMRKSGMADSEIRRALKKNKVADASQLMRGVFVPFSPSGTIKKKVRDNGNRLPISEINKIKQEFRQRRLGEAVEPQEQESGLLNLESSSQQPVAATANPPAVAQAGVVPPQPAAPAPVSQPQDTGGIMSFLSGGNPIDAIKNLQIFQRTQQ